MLERGAKVVIFDILPQAVGAEKVKDLSKDNAIYVQVDITDSTSTKAGVEKAVETFGNLKGVVHCAGITIRRDWSNDVADSIADFQKMINVNTVGTFIVNAHVADAINKPLNHAPERATKPFWTTDEERGVIINFSSAAAHGLYARTLTYGPTKAAVAGITRALSDFLGPSGIRVNSVSPSIVASAMSQSNPGIFDYFLKDLETHAAFPRKPATPKDISHTIAYLIENQFVNGEDIRVDGGWRLVTPNVPGEKDFRELAPGLE